MLGTLRQVGTECQVGTDKLPRMEKPTAWERQRAAVREEIASAAVALFLAQGFDATTIDQIIERVGVSRRSFFRYFGTKEDLVLGDLVARGTVIAQALADRPSDEGPWEAIRASFRDADEMSTMDPATTLAFGRMLYDTPSLLARHIEKRLRWQEMLVPLIAPRVPDGPDRLLRASSIVASSLACLDTASRAWVLSGGDDDLGALYDRAVAEVRS